MVESAGQTVAASPLLETQLYKPRWRPGLVSRPKLIERLDRGAERKLTLVSAPAGFGKTTLLSEWLAAVPASERPAAWVSLDRGDNDPALFWAYVVAALRKVRPGVGEGALSMLRSSQSPPVESVLATLINEINEIERDFALILDDFHVIDARPVHDGITFLLDHLPRQMHLVIASRADPPLPLGRLRSRGDLTELRAADLRFTPDEAASFLNQVMGLKLTAEDMATLRTRNEGWIAGLQLAALSMQGREDISGFITAFAGDDRYIVDYLAEEVLQRQPEHVRSFLLQTSILDRLSGPLCDAVTGREDGKGLLETLERGNLFVFPLDDKRQWYRYHHLFADFLRARLMEEQPDQVSALNRRAAAWFEEHGMAAEAIEQAHAAGDYETVARLLVANCEVFERTGHFASIARWAAYLPEEMVRNRPRLALMLSFSALRAKDNNQPARMFTSWAKDAISRIEDSGGLDPADDVGGTVVGPEGLDALKGEALALKIFHSWRDLSQDEMLQTAGRALELLPPGKGRLRGMVQMASVGLRAEVSGIESALPGLERIIDEARRAGDLPLLSNALDHHGEVCLITGRLEEGRRSFEEALAAAQEVSEEASLFTCGPHTRLAQILLEYGDLAGATDHAAKALELAGRSPSRSPVLYARTTAAQVFLAAGDTTTVMERLEEAQEFVRGSRGSRFSSFMSSVRLNIYCLMGDIEAATGVARDRGLSHDMAVDRDNGVEATAYARYLIARGDYGAAAQILSRVLASVREAGQVQHEVHALALQALAFELSGERAHALESLGRATMLGEPGRFNRTFTGEGPVMTALVEALADAVRRGRGPAETGSPSYLAYLLREAGAQPEMTSTTSVESQEDAPRPATPISLPEALSERELEVLALIASGASNQQIAEHLVVSMSTVKTHINRTYRKLGARSRTQAVAMGRQLGVL